MELAWTFFLAGVGLTGLWLQGSGRWFGWAFTVLGQSAWITYAVLFEQWGFLLGAFGYLWVAARNLLRWWRLERAGVRTPGTEPVCVCGGREAAGQPATG